MHRLIARCLPWSLFVCACPALFAQEGRVTISAMAGPAFVSLNQVEEDGRKDVAIYNRRGVPIGEYDPLSPGLRVEGQVEYRFDRDLSMNVFVSYLRTGAEALLQDSAQFLSLDRVISSADIGVDVRYYFPPLVYGAETALFVGLGRMAARAEQTTSQDHKEKSADTTITIVDQEAFAEYTKAKLYVRAGGAFSVPVSSNLLLQVQAAYTYAPLGTLDGTLREFSLIRPHTTTIEFDFSSFDLKLGMSYVFD